MDTSILHGDAVTGKCWLQEKHLLPPPVFFFTQSPHAGKGEIIPQFKRKNPPKPPPPPLPPAPSHIY